MELLDRLLPRLPARLLVTAEPIDQTAADKAAKAALGAARAGALGARSPAG